MLREIEPSGTKQPSHRLLIPPQAAAAQVREFFFLIWIAPCNSKNEIEIKIFPYLPYLMEFHIVKIICMQIFSWNSVFSFISNGDFIRVCKGASFYSLQFLFRCVCTSRGETLPFPPPPSVKAADVASHLPPPPQKRKYDKIVTLSN